MSRATLGATTYLWRNIGKTGPMTGVIVLAVMLVCGIVSLINSIPYSVKTIYSYSRHYLAVTPRGDATMTPVLKQIIESESPVNVERTMLVRGGDIQVRSIVGDWPFVVLALEQDDMRYYVDRVGGGTLVGRYPEAGAPEVMVSRPFAKNLKLDIGSVLLKPDDPDYFSPQEVKIVGILETDEWLALAPVEYFRANHFPPIDALLAFTADPAEQSQLDAWARERVKGMNALTFTYAELEEQADSMFAILYRILNVIILTLVLVITLMMGLLMNIYLSQRVQEFGLLQALGYTKRSLLRRVLGETALFVVIGWIAGMFTAYGLLLVVKAQLMDPQAFALDTFDTSAYLYTVPIPVAIFAIATLTILAKFRTFDPVGVVERRLV